MTKMIRVLSAAAIAFAISATAQAKSNKSPGIKVAKPAANEETYATRNIAQYSGGGFQHEIETFTTKGSFESGEASEDAGAGTILDIGAGYLYTLKDGFQVGGEGQVTMLSKKRSGTGKSETAIKLIGLVAYNFQSDFKSSFYAKGGIGLYPVIDNSGDLENQFGFQVGAGKRFPLWSAVTYNPEFNLIKAGDLDMAFQIKFLNFGIGFDNF